MNGSSSLGQGYINNTLIRPNIIEKQTRKHSRVSGTLLSGQLPSSSSKKNLSPHHSLLLPNRFLQNSLNLVTPKLSQQVGGVVSIKMSHCDSLPTDLASELSKKFYLDGHSELQVAVSSPSSSYPLQVDINIANSTGPMILHWGGIRGGQKEWILPSHHPDGTNKYKNKAFRTRFENSGSSSSLKLEIDEPEIEALEFLILDEARNKWLKNDGQNFRILMPWIDKPNLSSSAHINQILSPPEDLVQIHAYLRWERMGKKNYTPSEEKKEYEAARSELQLELDRGTSLEELRVKLTKNKKDTEEPHKEKKHLIDNTFDVHKPQNIMKENVQTDISKYLENKKHFTKERTHRKKWDIMELLKKYPSDAVEENKPLLPKVMTTLDLVAEAKLQHDDVFLLNKKTFKLGNKELLVLVTYSHGKTTVCLATDQTGPFVLHWALSRKPGEWMLPPSSVLPLNTVSLKQACETPFSHKYSEDQFSKVQSVEIEMPACDFSGMPFVIHSNGHWIKNDGLDFYVELVSEVIKERKDVGDGVGTAKTFLEKIADIESEAERSFMHRFNIASDLVSKAEEIGKLGFIGLLVWMRFMATRQLIWNKNYNVKPREISKAQDRLTDLLQNVYKRYPQYREISRLILSTVGRGGEGDVGQRIRDEILVIQRNNECKGGMMEEWHQKLHNNTSPDDVIICQALIDYIKNNFDINVYWNTLISNGITKERLLSYDRAIHSEPNFRSDQKNGLLHDLESYLRTLKAVHSGADLESSIATCMGYRAEGQGFMVGVQMNPIRGLPSGFPNLLQFIIEHIEDKEVEPLLEGLIEAREELRPILQNSHERLKDLIFLDIALDSTVRTAIEREYLELHNASPERIMYFVTLVLENLVISSDDNEDLIYCLKGWYTAIEMTKSNDDHWALFAKSFLDRTRLTLLNRAEYYEQILQPSAEYLGALLGIDQWAVSVFTEEIIRAGSAAPLSALLNRFDPTLRKVANLGSWQIISPVEVAGYIVNVDELLSVQHKSFEKPTILIAKTVKGEEEIPDGTVAVLTPDIPDVLSHVSVRARNCKICFATCFEPKILKDFQENEGKLFCLKPTSTDIIYGEINEGELSNGNLKEERPASSITLVKKKFLGRYAISSQEFTDDMVGAKSRNTAFLNGKVPSSIGIPTSVAIPFGVFEKVLSDKSNKAVEDELKSLIKRLDHRDFGVLSEIRRNVLQLTAPSQLISELKEKMQESGMPWPGDEEEHRWEQAWLAIKKVWASKWNDRAYFSTRKAKLDHNYLCMAVLVQEIISADYAFVIHTTNPSSGNSSEIYTEVVKGLGETLVGAYPGRALCFVCNKSDLDSPKVLGYPSKPVGLFIRPSIIFRSDSNGEDLEGYAGAGLYDSVPMDKEDEVIVDYSTDPVIMDLNFRKSILSRIARTGHEIEKLYGFPQDIEGVVKDGKITVVQTRPQM